MLNVMIYGKGTQFRVFHVDDETKERKDVSASYRLGDMTVVDKDGQRLAGFFVGEAVGRAKRVDELEGLRRIKV